MYDEIKNRSLGDLMDCPNGKLIRDAIELAYMDLLDACKIEQRTYTSCSDKYVRIKLPLSSFADDGVTPQFVMKEARVTSFYPYTLDSTSYGVRTKKTNTATYLVDADIPTWEFIRIADDAPIKWTPCAKSRTVNAGVQNGDIPWYTVTGVFHIEVELHSCTEKFFQAFLGKCIIPQILGGACFNPAIFRTTRGVKSLAAPTQIEVIPFADGDYKLRVERIMTYGGGTSQKYSPLAP